MQPGYSASYTGGQERLSLREHRPPEVRSRPRGTPEASEVGTNLSDAPPGFWGMHRADLKFVYYKEQAAGLQWSLPESEAG